MLSPKKGETGRGLSTNFQQPYEYCKTWPLLAEDVERLSVFDHRCLRSIARIWWEHRISNAEERRMVFGRNNSPSIDELITLHRLRWLGHQLEHEAAWFSTFSCLETSQTGDSAGFQVNLSQNLLSSLVVRLTKLLNYLRVNNMARLTKVHKQLSLVKSERGKAGG
ncbi:hypothetical protein CSKR_104398 [Clonorchis sinensis]|uniref:Uncharacterized protein n=1 Tax=Clonorchis sinensis TaxID=79923 RepID=A0A3R7CA51_CLOSI|nr:hypothetical protein CSKR_104398 [Clonorchis sinensis]